MSLGGQTVTLRTLAYGARGRQGLQAATPTDTDVTGCLFRPLETTETTGGNTDVATPTFKVTLPPVAASLAADEKSMLIYDGTTYEVTAVQKYPDLSGQIDHVTILCRTWVA